MALPRFSPSLSAVTSEVAPAMRSKTGDEHVKKTNLEHYYLQMPTSVKPLASTSSRHFSRNDGIAPGKIAEPPASRWSKNSRSTPKTAHIRLVKFTKKQRTTTCQPSDLVTRSSDDHEYDLTIWASASSQCKLIVSSLPSLRHDRSY